MLAEVLALAREAPTLTDSRCTFPEAIREPLRARIIVFQSTPEQRAAIAGALRCDGYNVIEAEDETHLWLLLEAAFDEDGSYHPVDLVIADGAANAQPILAVLARLRRHDGETPFILTTAGPDAGVAREARRLGVTAVFHNPLTVDALRVLVSTLVPWRPRTAK